MAKKKLKLKLKKGKMSRKLVKDKAIVNFLWEHMKTVKIDFSNIKIPSFSNILENEGNKSNNLIIFNNEKIFNKSPKLGASLLNNN